MNTKKSVLANNQEFKTLINAVINRVGLDNIDNINKNGINGGYHGFIYYTDTHTFATRHRKQIIKMLENFANDMGVDIDVMISGFTCFNGNPMDYEEKKELFTYLSGGKCYKGSITNIMAWFAGEEVCRMFENK